MESLIASAFNEALKPENRTLLGLIPVFAILVRMNTNTKVRNATVDGELKNHETKIANIEKKADSANAKSDKALELSRKFDSVRTRLEDKYLNGSQEKSSTEEIRGQEKKTSSR